MAKKRLGRWAVLIVLIGASGCCTWCDRHCPRAEAYSPLYAPACCPAPVCCPGSPYGAAPAQYQPNWSNPQPVYNSQAGCCQ